MYGALLVVHSLVRWPVVILGLLAAARAVAGWFGRKPWTATDNSLGLWFSIALDIQFLLGFALYLFLSPFTTEAFQDFGAAMRNAPLRFWAVEHIGLMLVAVILVHVGRVSTRRAGDATARHRRAAVFSLLVLLAILAAIPWPGTANGRPLLRVSW
jgi:hypothetical protein